ncbi:MAG TPA: VWA domain-containing protein [Bryobacteraceae bacterium]
MIDLNVIAVDNHGQPVTDLRRDEFRISDSGKEQVIAFFHHRDVQERQAPVLGPNELSNRNPINVPRATVILFDLLNERFGTRGATADRLIRGVGPLESADFVYLYLLTLDGRLFPVHGLPGVEHESADSKGAPWTSQIKPLLNKGLRAVTQTRPVDIDEAVRVQLTFRALDALAGELASVPGRKSIVWLTDGIPIELGPNRSDTGDFVDFTPLLRRMSDAFDRSGVAIYPVRQIMLGSPANVDGPNRSGEASIETLDEFSGLTGGRPDSSKDVGAAVRQAISDMQTNYQIGYYPPEKNWDDKFHKLRVSCTRRGVRIQAKTGYYAWRGSPGARSEQAITYAASTRFDAAEIGLRATLTPTAKGQRSVHINAQIDARDIILAQNGDQYLGQLRVAIVGYAPSQLVSRGPITPVDLHYGAQEREKVLQQGIRFTENLTLSENVTAVRLIVFDRESGGVGSLTIPVSQ